MNITRRAVEILDLVRIHGSCRISDLAEQLHVSDETIRRNVKSLVDRGLVIRMHGGIMVPDRVGELPFQKRMHENREAKQQIAALAAQQIKDGDSLILDGGVTNVYVAMALANHQHLHVVTNSTEIARTLVAQRSNQVYMAGGELRADDASAFGAQAREFLRRFQVRHAVLSIGAINTLGFLNQSPLESEFAQVAITQAERVIVVADHSKFGRDGFVKVCDTGKINMLVTDLPPPQSIASLLKKNDVEVLTCNSMHTANSAHAR